MSAGGCQKSFLYPERILEELVATLS
jgi:hypothetical protein